MSKTLIADLHTASEIQGWRQDKKADDEQVCMQSKRIHLVVLRFGLSESSSGVNAEQDV